MPAVGLVTTCPRCNCVTQEEDDDVSRYILCRTCGWLQNLTRSGEVYQPPAALDPEDIHPGGLGHRPKPLTPDLNHKHLPRVLRTGCRHHPDCFTCPFAECRFDMNHTGQRRLDWFQGWTATELASFGKLDVEVEAVRLGMTPRSIWRRLAILRKEAG